MSTITETAIAADHARLAETARDQALAAIRDGRLRDACQWADAATSHAADADRSAAELNAIVETYAKAAACADHAADLGSQAAARAHAAAIAANTAATAAVSSADPAPAWRTAPAAPPPPPPPAQQEQET